MRNRITLTAKTSILISIIVTTIIPFSYGIEWSPDTRLTYHHAGDLAPSITQTTDRNIWVAWHSNRESDTEIFYNIYNGSFWTDDRRLTWNASEDLHPSITQTMDENIWVVWDSDRTGDNEIFYKVYNGYEWSSNTQLTTNSSKDEFPSIIQAADGNIWVVWDSDRTGNYEIFYKVYDGSEWSSNTQLTEDEDSVDWSPSITQAADGNIWVVWTKDNDIFYKIYYGSSWTSDRRLTRVGAEWRPSITQTTDGNIWVVWDSFRNKYDTDIYYTVYNGSSWSSDTMLTTHSSQDEMPSILQAIDYTIWIVWTSSRTGFDIYYKTSRSLVPIKIRCDIAGVYEGWVEPIPDGRISLWDFVGVAANVFTEKPTWHPIWGPACDVNQDDRVGIDDLIIVGIYCGEPIP